MGDRSLVALQRFITDAVRRPPAAPDEPGYLAQAEALVATGKRGTNAAGRLEVYREQFWRRHVSNLHDDFPTLAWSVGEGKGFERLVEGYLQAYPPRTWNLQRLGLDVPKYVATESPWRDDVLAQDASRLDWAFMEAFDAPDAPPLDSGALASAPPEAWALARITFHPSLRALTFAHPVHELRDATRHGAHGRPAALRSYVVVWRDAGCSLRCAALEPMAFELLASLIQGAPLGAACDSLAAAADPSAAAELGEHVTRWFREWTASGWVSAVRPEA